MKTHDLSSLSLSAAASRADGNDSYGAEVTASPSRTAVWTGRSMSAVVILFLLLDGVMKLVKPAAVIEATVQLGYPESSLIGIGLALLAGVVLYAIPRTAVLGAILLTGYLGGAVATHVRVENPLLSHALFPVYFGVLIWGGLWLRNPRVRALIPAIR